MFTEFDVILSPYMNTTLFTNNSNILLALGIAALAIGLVLAIGWGVSRLTLENESNRWRQLAAAAQLLVLVGGIVSLIVFTGINTAIAMVAVAVVILSGIVFYKPEVVTKRLPLFQSLWEGIPHPYQSRINQKNDMAMVDEEILDTGETTAQRQEDKDIAASAETRVPNKARREQALSTSNETVTRTASSPSAVRQYTSFPAYSNTWRNRSPAALTKRPRLGERSIQDLR
ncbi:MAG: hypothetical protein AAF702_16240 [Chloroflexota bacterium]